MGQGMERSRGGAWRGVEGERGEEYGAERGEESGAEHGEEYAVITAIIQDS